MLGNVHSRPAPGCLPTIGSFLGRSPTKRTGHRYPLHNQSNKPFFAKRTAWGQAHCFLWDKPHFPEKFRSQGERSQSKPNYLSVLCSDVYDQFGRNEAKRLIRRNIINLRGHFGLFGGKRVSEQADPIRDRLGTPDPTMAEIVRLGDREVEHEFAARPCVLDNPLRDLPTLR
jgi:hypothetical protein